MGMDHKDICSCIGSQQMEKFKKAQCKQFQIREFFIKNQGIFSINFCSHPVILLIL